MADPEEFLMNTIEMGAEFTQGKDELMGFGKGFHIALACMFYHPEWGKAALNLLEDGVSKTERVASIVVKNLPIEVENDG